MKLAWQVEEEERPISPEVLAFIREMDTATAWQRWAAESCLERNGRHYWVLVIEYGSVNNLTCSICKSHLDYEHPSCSELLYAEIPLEIDVDYHRYPATPMGPEEWDVYVNGYPRPPAFANEVI